MRRVAIIHPWFPEYRVEMFRELRKRAHTEGIELHIFYGAAPPEWAARGDEVVTEDAVLLPTRYFRVGRRVLGRKSLAPLRLEGPWDLIIVEQVVRAIETYLLMLTPHHRIAMWGHGGSYTEETSRLKEYLKQQLTRRAVWFFAYTSSGRNRVVSAGYPEDRVTVLNNTIDVVALERRLAEARDEEIAEFKLRHGLNGHTALFIGGIDGSKRINFLLDAADRIRQVDPNFRLLILGDGDLRPSVQTAAARGDHVRYLGRAYGSEKVLALRAAQIIMMPGRVGLVAVESFVAGVPIVTTDWPLHAPEFDYIISGHNGLVVEDDVQSYASTIVELLRHPKDLAVLMEGARSSAPNYTLEHFVSNFVSGILNLLARQGRGV